MVDIRIIMVVLFCAVLGAVGQIELKRGSDSLALNLGSLLSNYHLIVGILIWCRNCSLSTCAVPWSSFRYIPCNCNILYMDVFICFIFFGRKH